MTSFEPVYGTPGSWGRLLCRGLLTGALAGAVFGLLYVAVPGIMAGSGYAAGLAPYGFLVGGLLGAASGFSATVLARWAWLRAGALPVWGHLVLIGIAGYIGTILPLVLFAGLAFFDPSSWAIWIGALPGAPLAVFYTRRVLGSGTSPI